MFFAKLLADAVNPVLSQRYYITVCPARAHAVVSILNGNEADRSAVQYGLDGNSTVALMSAFAALGAIAFR
jgi:hypothetical protein